MLGTPKSQRMHIAFFGRRNVGKSSLINALTGQELAIVSEVPGTTTDPVVKAMEILPLGPVVIIDTAGIDDVGKLGTLRKKKSYDVLTYTDLVLIVIDPKKGIGTYEKEVEKKAKEFSIPIIYVINKIDIFPKINIKENVSPCVYVSALTKEGIDDLKKYIIKYSPKDWTLPTIVGDLINNGDIVVCVVPIDKAAPKGRLILPQQMVIRDILDHEAISLVVKERELRDALISLNKEPSLVVTDASVYTKVAADLPPHIPLTSFSILLARYKGDLKTMIEGLKVVEELSPGDKVLIAEACTHHPLEDDIGRVKIPRWLRAKVGGEIQVEVKSGGGPLPEDINKYKVIIHCGACMLNRKQMLFRIMQAKKQGVGITNYGVILAYMHGILKRALSPFPQFIDILNFSDFEKEAEKLYKIKNIINYKKIANAFCNN